MLLKEKACLTAQTNDRDTSIHIAINNKDHEVMKILVEEIHKLESKQIRLILNIKNNSEKTILDLAKEKEFFLRSIKSLYNRCVDHCDLSITK
jgi:hypothetical protein